MKMENNEFKKVGIKNGLCYYFEDIIDFDNFQFVAIHIKLSLVRKLCALCSIK